MTKKKRNALMIIGASVMLLIILIAVTIHFLIAPALYRAKIEFGYRDGLNGANQYAEDVTMVQLIATPERYDGKLVRVIGVGNLEFEGNCLSLSKEDRGQHDIWLELGERATPYTEAQAYNGEWVIVEGFFDKDDHGHFGMFRGAIKNISRYELWGPFDFCDAYDQFEVDQNDDGTYRYTVRDTSDNVLLSEESVAVQPEFEPVTGTILGVYTQTGTTPSEKQVVFCDLQSGRISPTYTYALGAQGKYVFYADRDDNGAYIVVVRNIFSETVFYEEYVLADIANTDNPVIDCRLNGEGIIIITYLKGDSLTETERTIKFL